jgi:hypothetical protein
LLGAAVLLGFSERLLTEIAGKLDRHLVLQPPERVGTTPRRTSSGAVHLDGGINRVPPPAGSDAAADQVH